MNLRTELINKSGYYKKSIEWQMGFDIAISLISADGEDSGMEKVMVCPCNCNHHPANACCNCIGGEIVTPLSRDEAVEWAKGVVEFCEHHPYYNVKPDRQVLILPDGSRIRAKEAKCDT